MEVYKAECAEILKRFKAREINQRQCLAALDAALSGVLPSLTPEGLGAVQRLIAENHQAIAQEVGRRKYAADSGPQAIN